MRTSLYGQICDMVILGAGDSDEDAADTKVGECDPERVSIVQTAVAETGANACEAPSSLAAQLVAASFDPLANAVTETGANACEAPRSLAAHTCNHHEIAVAVAGANACEAPSTSN